MWREKKRMCKDEKEEEEEEEKEEEEEEEEEKERGASVNGTRGVTVIIRRDKMMDR